MNINGKMLTNFRFADDIALIAESVQELQTNLQELATESRKRGLKINWNKTKLMRNTNTASAPLKVDNQMIEEVESYISLGQRISLQEKDMDKEISRRIQAGWKAYNGNKIVFKSNMPISLKRKVFNQCVLPTMIYGAETWAITKQMRSKIASAQRSMERNMLGITWQDYKTNEWVRSQTKLTDITEVILRKKWTWAGHVARMKDSRWTYEVTNWKPWLGKRKRGRPNKRWRDEPEG